MTSKHKELFNGLCTYCDALIINNFIYIKLISRGEKSARLIEKLNVIENKEDYVVILDLRELLYVNSLDISTILNLKYSFKEIYIIVHDFLSNEKIFSFFNIHSDEFKIISNIDEILNFLDEEIIECSRCIKED